MEVANFFKLLKDSLVVRVFVLVALFTITLQVFPQLKEVQCKRSLQKTLEKHPVKAESVLKRDSPIDEIERNNPNLPIVFWKAKKSLDLRLNDSCALLPNIFFLNYDNMYWQKLSTSNGTFFMIGAYKDIRKKNPTPSVRILTLVDTQAPRVNTTCQLWFEEKNQPSLSPVVDHTFVWYTSWGYSGPYQPYLLNCLIPPKDAKNTLRAVSLVEKPCDNAENLLKVIYKPAKQKKDFAVCVKSISFPTADISVRLIEWIELVLLLGADKIFFYTMEMHPNATKALEYYTRKGVVEVTPFSLPGSLPNGPYLRHHYLYHNVWRNRKVQQMQLNDCFYRHMYEYDYIAVLDIDEVIMPVQAPTWGALMKATLPKAAKQNGAETSSLHARRVYFMDDMLHSHGWFDDVPRYMHMLQHVYRSRRSPPGQNFRSFHNTELVVVVHISFSLRCLESNCNGYAFDTDDAQLQHYTTDCPEKKERCEEFMHNSVMDPTIWRYKKQLIRRVSFAMMELGYIDMCKEMPWYK